MRKEVAYARLNRLVDSYLAAFSDVDIDFRYCEEVPQNNGQTIPSDDNQSFLVSIGVKGMVNRFNWVSVERFVEAALDISHEFRHVEQYTRLFLDDRYEKVACSAAAEIDNEEYYLSTYYDQLNEIDATEYAYRSVASLLKDYYKVEKTNSCLLNIANARFDETGKSFALDACRYRTFDDFISAVSVKKDTVSDEKSEFHYAFKSSEDVLDIALRSGDSNLADAWNSAKTIGEKNTVAAAYNLCVNPSYSVYFPCLRMLDISKYKLNEPRLFVDSMLVDDELDEGKDFQFGE